MWLWINFYLDSLCDVELVMVFGAVLILRGFLSFTGIIIRIICLFLQDLFFRCISDFWELHSARLERKIKYWKIINTVFRKKSCHKMQTISNIILRSKCRFLMNKFTIYYDSKNLSTFWLKMAIFFMLSTVRINYG